MEKEPIEVECVIRAEMTVIIPMDTQGNMRVDNVRCKVFVKDEIGGNEE